MTYIDFDKYPSKSSHKVLIYKRYKNYQINAKSMTFKNAKSMTFKLMTHLTKCVTSKGSFSHQNVFPARNLSFVMIQSNLRHECHTRATRMRHECDTGNMSAIRVLHERHECNTSATPTTRVQHESYILILITTHILTPPYLLHGI